jgi:hypothetical protein
MAIQARFGYLRLLQVTGGGRKIKMQISKVKILRLCYPNSVLKKIGFHFWLFTFHAQAAKSAVKFGLNNFAKYINLLLQHNYKNCSAVSGSFAKKDKSKSLL